MLMGVRLKVEIHSMLLQLADTAVSDTGDVRWSPFIKGASGREWYEELGHACLWLHRGLQIWLANEGSAGGRIVGMDVYWKPGIAFTMIGSSFSARAHRFRSIIGHKGSSVFPSRVPSVACAMNSAKSRFILESLNPGIGFEVGDVNRLPIFPVESADEIFATIERAFTEHESHREASVEFRAPGPSPESSSGAFPEPPSSSLLSTKSMGSWGRTHDGCGCAFCETTG